MFGRPAATPQPLDTVPDGVPVLSRGRHRNPRKGACFMEMASYLAGERWSDHPKCTHAVLASLARCVNDALGDVRRQELAVMIPEVVGLNPDDRRVAPLLMRRAALAALPIASAERQNIMALAVMGAERHLNDLAGRDPDELTPETTAALAAVPGAEKWAHDFVRRVGTRDLRAEAAAKVVALAVNGIARACVDDPSADLVRLLRQAIDDTKAVAAEQAASRTTAALPMAMQEVRSQAAH
ncbi:hypothetical protein [Intrasporangium calvum]|uniref:Uncharacterized protein n=1 Tax=Intrasporangium calvum (strain ATCC 23552 / DSM 43043 / JCM 3097 / NBRC 12989 / NCIMB 10167 / NRRL B-3866 / 7 KIP) TaxID=710696 RepID=E6S6W1_INTC7|nr:hypothetical protein [Intrasporangium calvum]ADU46847.1 hypothetical protein Intca_0292 [Intrasporangium calvum DSM 43043]AXG12121.1 hypothetical protein DN585_00505 [Intrasporangium calvum]